ncbi:HAMP domain-containing protein [Paenibacillus albiflavus]|uniref:histidine kinase n=2 Tax=Paenibacillus albiflavus TaxID=2545760 RepID=A0A4R4ED57_9BACL|nr:HAMP domain-containing protein [Paenibacillus albiflavus]
MKLFIFIPVMVIIVNLVTVIIYQSGRSIQESYNLMLDRILLYKQISYKTEDNLRVLSSYVVEKYRSQYIEFLELRAELQMLKGKLSEKKRNAEYNLALDNYMNILQTYLDATDTVISALDENDMQTYSSAYEEAEKTATYIKEDHQNLVDMELSFYQPLYKKMLLTSNNMYQIDQALLITNLVLCFVFTIWLSRSITTPIGRLLHTARQISKGNLEAPPPPIHSTDEIGILTVAFRHMQLNIKELMIRDQKRMEQERLVKELEIKALQSQINPHFLFNTLNVLSRLAMLEGAERTSDLTVSVSNLLRYNLRKLDQAVTLQEEVDNAREYFTIQQARFRDRITFLTEIEESALVQVIPSMTLQPLLENAFEHGIEGMEDGAYIKLVINREGDQVVIRIIDNGAGMSEETRLLLLQFDSNTRSDISRNNSTGLGTRNVFRRLQLFYSVNDLIEIESTEGQGTTIAIRVPYRTKGEMHHVSLANSG